MRPDEGRVGGDVDETSTRIVVPMKGPYHVLVKDPFFVNTL